MLKTLTNQSSRTPEILIAAVTITVHLLIAVTHGGPVALPDVSAYLSYGQYLHGGYLIDPTPYFPGYGLAHALFGNLPGPQLHRVGGGPRETRLPRRRGTVATSLAEEQSPHKP